MADEYIRKQDAVEALDGKIIVIGHKNADAVLQYMKDISNKIKSLPPADVVRVVRCKDCKHHAYDEIFSCYWCEYPGRVRDTTPDGFCEKGEE